MFGVLLVTFALVHAVPGDPALLLAGEGASAARVQEVRHQLGSDRPLARQFITYVTKVAHGDLGDSTSLGQPVTTVLAQRVRPTLLLGGTALLISIVGGLFLGLTAARRPFGATDHVVSTVSLVGYATPAFWLAQIAALVLSVHLGWVPLLGYTDARHHFTGFNHLSDIAYHLALPATVLAISEMALLTRVTRSGLVQEAGRDYVRTAKAKGLPDDRILSHHVMRNALLPVVTVIGTRVGFLFSGAVVIETVFSWPGLGSVITSAARDGDREMMIGLVLLVSLCVILANLVTDVMYGWIDPRVRDH
ncbi:MAG: peptide/nickel transport system permease protein [Acidimicrobiaceae bacterium]|jgi:peptide/nickel transport system permease protein|nr:peptide/nickel transport system permease protein [Acidimicrobiaceae bacterium]